MQLNPKYPCLEDLKTQFYSFPHADMASVERIPAILKLFSSGTFLFALILILLVCPYYSFGADLQYWNEFKVTHALAKNLDGHIKSDQRLVDDMSKLGLYNFTLGIVYKIHKHFDFELNYKFESGEVLGIWIDEHRIEMIPILKADWNGFQFKLRNRVEYRIFEDDEFWRLREKFIIKKEVAIFGEKISPYLSNEIFYSFSADEFNQNRLSVGLSKNITPNLELTLYYLNRRDKIGEDWRSINVLGTGFTVRF